MIYILSYDVPHRKTYDVCNLLNAYGQKFKIFGMPLHYEKKHTPLIEHRPPLTCQVSPKYAFKGYEDITSYEQIDIPTKSIVLMCGGGILPQEFIERHIVLNSHPGMIDYCRGLDALKWAIYEDLPIGITVHRITDIVDYGDVYYDCIMEPRKNDTFHSFAYRQYQHEIESLVIHSLVLDKPVKKTGSPNNSNPVRKRMPKEKEIELLYKFERRKK